MASVEKIIQKMRVQPKGIRPEEADKVLRTFGYELRRIRGSHKQYRDARGDVITIVQRNRLYEYEVSDILKRIGE